jgi:hypothetical protein
MLLQLSRKRALQLDLLWCKCGHRPNNHHTFHKKPCAHCNCKKYREKAVWGASIVKTTPRGKS